MNTIILIALCVLCVGAGAGLGISIFEVVQNIKELKRIKNR